MNPDLLSINKKILKAGKKDANKFLYTYLDNEDKIVELLKNVDGIKSEIYLKEVDKSLNELLKFSSVFSDITFLNTTTSAINPSHLTYFDTQSNYWRDRQLTIPSNYVRETGIDPKRFLPCYINRQNSEIKKIFSKYKELILSNKLLVRPLRSICVTFPEVKESVVYYVDPNTSNDHWYINEINEKQHIIIDNGISQHKIMKLFELTLPYFDNIDIDSLSKILNEEKDILSTFRFQLKEMINEVGDNIDNLQELKQDIIQPAIDTINRKFTKIANTHRLSIGASIGTFALTLVVATVNGNLLQALGGALPVGGMLLSENNYQDKIDGLKDNPYYLLWRIQREK